MPEAEANVNVVHNEAENRFEAAVGGGLALAAYIRKGNRIHFTHTEVPEEARHHGVGGALARAGLDYARSANLEVVPRCPFIAAYIERNPEYRDVVVKR
jgi:predicted GNAT family acetyltransferase